VLLASGRLPYHRHLCAVACFQGTCHQRCCLRHRCYSLQLALPRCSRWAPSRCPPSWAPTHARRSCLSGQLGPKLCRPAL
jgi:hypothetical protein